MGTMNLRPVFRYRFRETLKSTGVVLAIMVVIMAGLTGLISYSGSDGQVSGSISLLSFALTISLFIMGISMIREDLRLMLQNGIGRRTIFAAELLAALSVSLLLAVAGELLLTFWQAITASQPGLVVTDLYQLLYTSGTADNPSFRQHAESIALFFILFTWAHLAGIFISLLFYSLNKMWTLIVAIGTPLLLFLALRTAHPVKPFLEAVFGAVSEFALNSPWALFLCFFSITLLIVILTWPLIRQAPIKPAK